MAEDKVELPVKLATKVKEILKEKFSIENNSNIFSIYHLALIDDLNINQPMPGILDGIEKLPNLQSLKIESVGNTAVYHQKIKILFLKKMLKK